MGLIFSYILGKNNKKIGTILTGFTSGMLISYICFEMLPVAFNLWGLYKSVLAILIGVLFSTLLEHKITLSNLGKNNLYLKIGLIIAIGIGMHNLPEGIALGAMYNYNKDNASKLALLIGLHCLPEAMAFTSPLQKAKLTFIELLKYVFYVSIPMLIGLIIGVYGTNISPIFLSICLSFSGGIMLYVACGGVIPESDESWERLGKTLSACIGFLFGIIVIYK